jgi:hypothetical protein
VSTNTVLGTLYLKLIGAMYLRNIQGSALGQANQGARDTIVQKLKVLLKGLNF